MTFEMSSNSPDPEKRTTNDPHPVIGSFSNREEHTKEVKRGSRLFNEELKLMKDMFRDGSEMESLKHKELRLEMARAGVEFELYVLDEKTLEPAPVSEEFMAALGNPKWLVKEAAKCVVEINAYPFMLEGSGLRELENWFIERLEQLRSVPGYTVYLGGTVSTLTQEHMLNRDFFSKGERYKQLVEKLAKDNGSETASITLDGDKEPIKLETLRLMPSGIFCGIQPHLQLSPDRFVDQYNAVVVSSPLHLAMNANSTAPGHDTGPLEARLQMLSQGIDEKRLPLSLSSKQHAENPWDPFEDALKLDPLFNFKDTESDPKEMKNVLMRCSEVWRRIRGVWGTTEDENGNILGSARTEHRVSGMQPTPVDSVANMALQYALTLYLLNLKEHHGFDYTQYMSHEDAETELELASKHGPAASLNFPVLEYGDDGSSTVTMVNANAAELTRKILPELRDSLLQLGIDQADVDRYIGHLDGDQPIGVIAGRATANNGEGICPAEVARKIPLAEQLRYQEQNIATHFWVQGESK